MNCPFFVSCRTGPNGQEILGVVAYSSELGQIKMSGRQLNCRPHLDGQFTTMGFLSFQGQDIMILAYPNSPEEPWLDDGECQAFIDNEKLSCLFGSPVIGAY